MIGLVYLLHFERPISPRHTCQHYAGWALDLTRRLAVHRSGRGARLTAVAVERGISFEVAQTWPGDRCLERYIKDMKRGSAICPACALDRVRALPAPTPRYIRARAAAGDLCAACAASPYGPLRFVYGVEQLTLPLDLDGEQLPDFPAGPALPIDGVEIGYLRRWRATIPAQPSILDQFDQL